MFSKILTMLFFILQKNDWYKMNRRKHKSCLYYLCYILSLLKAYSLVPVCLMISIDVKHDMMRLETLQL